MATVSSTTSTTGATGQSIITALGAGSGIDIQALSTNLTNATKQAAQSLIDKRKTIADTQVSSVGKVLSAAAAFKSSLTGLGEPSLFQRAPTTSDSSKLSVEFESGTMPDQFSSSVEISQLATESKMRFAPMSSLSGSLLGTLSDGTASTTDLTLTLTGKDSTDSTKSTVNTLTISSSTTLTSLKDQINSISGYTASIITGGTSSSPEYYLSVKHGTGEISQFTATVTGADSGTTSALAQDTVSGVAVQTLGQDAIMSVDGVTVQSSSNVFDNAIPGVKLTALAVTGTNESIEASSAASTTAMTNALSTFISGYNALLDTIATESKYDVDPTKSGGLANVSATQSLLAELRSYTSKSLSGYSDSSYTLASIGVSTQTDGKLSLDAVKFAYVINNSPSTVEAVLASRKAISDSQLSIASTTSSTLPGTYTLKKDSTSSTGWMLDGAEATISGNTITAASTTNAAGLKITIPDTVIASAEDGYTTNVYFAQGIVERFTNMMTSLSSSTSSMSRLEADDNTQLTKIATEQTTLDTQMDQLKTRYLNQFAAMDSYLAQAKSTQSSLTNFVTSWTASLKA